MHMHGVTSAAAPWGTCPYACKNAATTMLRDLRADVDMVKTGHIVDGWLVGLIRA
jgi:hypothetical protein